MGNFLVKNAYRCNQSKMIKSGTFRTTQAASRGQKNQTTTYSNKSRRTFVLHFFSHTLGRKKCVRYVVTQCTIVSVTHDIRLRLAEFRAEIARPLIWLERIYNSHYGNEVPAKFIS